MNSSRGSRDVLQQGHGAEQGAHLVHDPELADDPVPLRPGGRDQVVFAVQDLAVHGLVQADHVLEQGGLAAAGPAQDDEDLACVDVKGDVLEDDGLPVAAGEAAHADDGFAALHAYIPR